MNQSDIVFKKDPKHCLMVIIQPAAFVEMVYGVDSRTLIFKKLYALGGGKVATSRRNGPAAVLHAVSVIFFSLLYFLIKQKPKEYFPET